MRRRRTARNCSATPTINLSGGERDPISTAAIDLQSGVKLDIVGNGTTIDGTSARLHPML